MWGGGEGGGAAQPPARPSAAGISAGRLCLTPGLSLGSALEAGRPGEKGPDSDPRSVQPEGESQRWPSLQQRPFHRRNPPHTAAGWASGQHSLHLGQICSPTQPKTQKPGLGQIPPPPPDPKGRGRQACVWGGRVPGTLQQLQPHPSADDPGSIGTSGAPAEALQGAW